MRKEFERLAIENIFPQIDCGKFPIKRVVGEVIAVSADIFTEGSYVLGANLIWKKKEQKKWNTVSMQLAYNDSWHAQFTPEEVGNYVYAIEAWIDYFATWRMYVRKKVESGTFSRTDIEHGVQILKQIKLKDPSLILKVADSIEKSTSGQELVDYLNQEEYKSIPAYLFGLESFTQSRGNLELCVKRKKALFSTWYELFPRSASSTDKHGTFLDCIKQLPRIAEMGFDVLYLPPIHPIGKTARKGFNNALIASENAPGSPWAIGSKDGGHDVIHPQLGDLKSFGELIKKANELGLEIALDLAFQCSPDHPYLKSNPEWFQWRSDGSVQFAENPPKKYEDIVPFYFDTPDWKNLWNELKRVVIYWVDHGVKIFRVDNPHTKPFGFWEWLIKEVNHHDPNVIFLSEAFTRPKLMQGLAKIGFDQSYTYFTWRNTKNEIESYIKELTYSNLKEYFRPNFWPNTPDILPEALQHGGKNTFISRYVLAATLSSNCGIYGPAYELCVNTSLDGKEEYLDSEKYQIKTWNLASSGNIADLIALINKIRKKNSALQTTSNTEFINTENDKLIAYIKRSYDRPLDSLLVIVNLDFNNTQSGMVNLPLESLGLNGEKPFLVHDLVTQEKYIWNGSRNYVELNPHILPMHIFRFHHELNRENNFEYYI